MSFERTQQSIKNLSGSDITAEAMLDMLIRTTKDVYENNGVKGANDLRVADGRQLVIKMNNLMNLLSRIYANHPEVVSQVTDETREDLKSAAAKLKEKEQVISALDRDITAAEERKTALTKQEQEVNRKSGHLRNVRAECSALQMEIDALNDPHLERLAERKAELEADRNARKTKSDELQKEISDLNGEIADLTTARETDEKQLGELAEEKIRLDDQLKAIRQQIEEAKTAIENHDQHETELRNTLQDLQDQLTEREARFSVIQSAWNSAAKDAFLQGKLFSGRGELTQEEQPDLAVTAQSVENFEQLEHWFEKTGERIEGLLQVYGAMLGGAVERAKQLTAEQEGENG